ncbi:hypothetical protein OPQ81_001093 [Rhizoctonia solani]|nr:hypothetical protein OPQ81_001093 [Rhizoctonia solani]
MAKHRGYVFKPTTQDLTYSAQLQEWADYYAVELKWAESSLQTNGVTEWYAYPLIQGYHYDKFQGKATNLRTARQISAQMIIESPGTLDTARTRPPPAIIPRVL